MSRSEMMANLGSWQWIILEIMRLPPPIILDKLALEWSTTAAILKAANIESNCGTH